MMIYITLIMAERYNPLRQNTSLSMGTASAPLSRKGGSSVAAGGGSTCRVYIFRQRVLFLSFYINFNVSFVRFFDHCLITCNVYDPIFKGIFCTIFDINNKFYFIGIVNCF